MPFNPIIQTTVIPHEVILVVYVLLYFFFIFQLLKVYVFKYSQVVFWILQESVLSILFSFLILFLMSFVSTFGYLCCGAANVVHLVKESVFILLVLHIVVFVSVLFIPAPGSPFLGS